MIDGGHAHAWEEENEGVDLEGHRAQMGLEGTHDDVAVDK